MSCKKAQGFLETSDWGIAGEVVDAKIGPVRAQFLSRDGEIYGLQKGVGG